MEKEDRGQDPLWQLKWLRETFSELRSMNKKAIVASHIPIGVGNGFDGEVFFGLNNEYDSDLVGILAEYIEDVILVNLWGHQHTSQFWISDTNRLLALNRQECADLYGGRNLY
ncbi:hypothetical protein ACOME3_003138 [Neoechinorhynchus agilis]